jgi:branched-chain amino acid aminotransferase
MLLLHMLVYVDGHFVAREQARVSVFDHGFLYGDGIYETMRAYRGDIFLLKKHLARLKRSADAVSLTLPLPLEKIGEALKESVFVNKLQEAVIRLQVSRGPGEPGLDPALCDAPTMVIITKPFRDYPPAYYDRGVGVAVVTTRRNHPRALPSAVKSTNFLNNILAKIEAIEAGAFEGIMLNGEGFVAEGTVSNIFTVRKGKLYTPHVRAGILEGVTRELVLRLARRRKIPVREAMLLPKDLRAADECFLTNTTMEIMPVTAIGAKRVGTGRPGPVTAALRQAYGKEVRRCSKTQAT